MFIETLEFTIPVELCNVFSNLQKGQRSNVEFPASVNSYGTTQDANIQVVLRSNKLTFKVDGVSSNASMISKSECKTLKLSVFDVDHTLMPQEEEQQVYSYNNDMSTMQHTMTMSVPTKRLHEQSVSLPPAKSSRTSYSESPRPRSPAHRRRSQPQTSTPRSLENSQSKSHNDTPVNVKQEPEDPDLIEIEPDDIVPKKETPYMQIDYSSEVPHTQTSQAALDRVSHPESTHSQSPASSSSSFHRNVPHVPDYAEPGPSQIQHHGDQSADDFLVFQEQDDNEDLDDNDVDYGNDDGRGSVSFSQSEAENLLVRKDSDLVEVDPEDSVPLSPIHGGSEEAAEFLAARIRLGHGYLPARHSVIHSGVQSIGVTFKGQRHLGVSPLSASPTNLVSNVSSIGQPLDARMMKLQPGAMRVVKCPQCDLMFSNKSAMMNHKTAVHDKVTFECVCGKTYKYKPGLLNHQQRCSLFSLRKDAAR